METPPPAPRKKLADMTGEEMLAAIDSLRPKDELSAGIRFYKTLLKEKGPAGVIAWSAKSREILDKEGKLLHYDFEEEFAKLAQRANPNLGTRRKFLHTGAWAIGGLITTGWSLAKIGEQVSGYAQRISGARADAEEPKVNGHNWVKNICKTTGRFIDDNFMGPAELLIGIALINEYFVNRDEIRYDEISNALAEFGTLMDEDASRPVRRRRRNGSGHSPS